MTENKLTFEEIKKALEYLPDRILTETERMAIENALDLINRQQAEIERLNVELVGMRGACNSYKMHYDNAKAEIERLRENNKAIMQPIADVHTEAIKEFAEKLKDKHFSFGSLQGNKLVCKYAVELFDIDNLV